MSTETTLSETTIPQARYRAEDGAVIDTETGTVWYSGWEQREAEAIAEAHNTGDWSRIITRPGGYVEGVKR